MDKEAIIKEVSGVVRDLVIDKGLELIEVISRYEGGRLAVRILLDRPEGGITMEECAAVNSALGDLLDEKDILQQNYILEVSSPGVDRPLLTRNDFFRCKNRRVRVFLKQPLEDKSELEGLISQVEEASVHINTGTEVLVVPLSNISRAKQVIN